MYFLHVNIFIYVITFHVNHLPSRHFTQNVLLFSLKNNKESLEFHLLQFCLKLYFIGLHAELVLGYLYMAEVRIFCDVNSQL